MWLVLGYNYNTNQKKEIPMKMISIVGGIASSAAITASALIYPSAKPAVAAAQPETVYVERVVEVERVVYVPQPLPEPELMFADMSAEDRHCLALNVYFESKGESLLGQAAVAWVTLNRVTHSEFPNDVCSTVWQSSQFSWTNDGKSDVPSDETAWATAQQIVEQVIQEYGSGRDPVDGATYFHASYVKPDWAQRFERVVRVDGHIFYADRG
jgi:spore germination cell wall hydrolase CwlJ-like protein